VAGSRKIRRESHRQEAASASRIDVIDDGGFRSVEMTVANDTHCPTALRDENAAVRRKGEIGWLSEAFGD